MMKKLPIALAFLLFSCGIQIVESRLAEGTYGGENCIINVSETNCSIQWGCANGSFSLSDITYTGNQFTASGTYKTQPGIIPEDPALGPKEQKATYTGTFTDQKLTLVVTLTDTNAQIGSFTATMGQLTLLKYCQ